MSADTAPGGRHTRLELLYKIGTLHRVTTPPESHLGGEAVGQELGISTGYDLNSGLT